MAKYTLKLELVINRNGIPAIFTTKDKAYLVKPDPTPIIELPKKKTAGTPSKQTLYQANTEPKRSFWAEIARLQ
jgi:hypothetical protein